MKIKALLYCTKAKPTLYNVLGKFITTKYMGKDFKQDGLTHPELNGKIVAECDYDDEGIIYNHVGNPLDDFYGMQLFTKTLKESELSQLSKINSNELRKYLLRNEDDYISPLAVGYVIYVENLHIFDEPKELNEVYKIEDVGGMLFTKSLTNAPKNMMRVSVNYWEYATYNPDDIRIIIPVSPQEMCRIANKEQTILIRRRMVKTYDSL
jgi:hypothetical protein